MGQKQLPVSVRIRQIIDAMYALERIGMGWLPYIKIAGVWS